MNKYQIILLLIISLVVTISSISIYNQVYAARYVQIYNKSPYLVNIKITNQDGSVVKQENLSEHRVMFIRVDQNKIYEIYIDIKDIHYHFTIKSGPSCNSYIIFMGINNQIQIDEICRGQVGGQQLIPSLSNLVNQLISGSIGNILKDLHPEG